MKNRKLLTLFYFITIQYLISQFIPYKTIDPTLYPYKQEFLTIVNEHCSYFQYFHPIQEAMYFDDLQNGMCAYSLSNRLSKLNVVVNIRYWNNATDDMKYSTMMHEFSHGYLEAKHSDNPLNYMWPYENYLPKELVKAQLIEALILKCGK